MNHKTPTLESLRSNLHHAITTYASYSDIAAHSARFLDEYSKSTLYKVISTTGACICIFRQATEPTLVQRGGRLYIRFDKCSNNTTYGLKTNTDNMFDLANYTIHTD